MVGPGAVEKWARPVHRRPGAAVEARLHSGPGSHQTPATPEQGPGPAVHTEIL